MNQALLERERVDENFHELIDLASEAVFLARRNGELLHVNEAACALSGHTRSALLKLPIDRTFPLEQAAAALAHMRANAHFGKIVLVM